jgi:DNA primase large subunit
LPCKKAKILCEIFFILKNIQSHSLFMLLHIFKILIVEVKNTLQNNNLYFLFSAVLFLPSISHIVNLYSFNRLKTSCRKQKYFAKKILSHIVYIYFHRIKKICLVKKYFAKINLYFYGVVSALNQSYSLPMLLYIFKIRFAESKNTLKNQHFISLFTMFDFINIWFCRLYILPEC